MSDINILGSPKRGLIGATLGFFIGFAAVTLFAPLVGYISLTPGEKGLLLAIASLTGSLLRIPFAAWVDTTGGKKPMIVLLSIALLGMIGISIMLKTLPQDQLKNNFSLLLLFGALAGCGIATFSVGIGQTSYWYSQKEQGKALGVYAGIGNLAPGIFVFLITSFLLKSIGLPNTYVLWTIMLALGILAYSLIGQNAWFFQLCKQGKNTDEAKQIAQQEYKQELFPKGTVVQSLVSSAKIWQTWIMVFVYFFSFGGFLALTNWFKVFFTDYHGFSIAAAGGMTSLYSIGASLARVGSGSIADKIGGRKITNISLIICLFGTFFLATNGNLSANIVGLLCLTLGMGVVNAGVFKMLPAFVPSAVGGAAGWVGGLGALGGFVLPLVLSRMLSTSNALDTGYLNGFYVFTVLIILSIVLVNVLPKQNK